MLHSGLELCLCVAADGWEAPLRADLFGFHAVRVPKQLWVGLEPSFACMPECPSPFAAGRMQHMLCLCGSGGCSLCNGTAAGCI